MERPFFQSLFIGFMGSLLLASLAACGGKVEFRGQSQSQSHLERDEPQPVERDAAAPLPENQSRSGRLIPGKKYYQATTEIFMRLDDGFLQLGDMSKFWGLSNGASSKALVSSSAIQPHSGGFLGGTDYKMNEKLGIQFQLVTPLLLKTRSLVYGDNILTVAVSESDARTTADVFVIRDFHLDWLNSIPRPLAPPQNGVGSLSSWLNSFGAPTVATAPTKFDVIGENTLYQ